MAPLPLALAGARLRAARGRQCALVLALGLAAVIPIVVGASAALTARAALDRALDSLPASERSVTVPFSGTLGDAGLAALDGAVHAQLGSLVGGPPIRELEYRELSDGVGDNFVLAATDGLAGRVRLLDGRLPRACTPSRCEVVVDGAADPVLKHVAPELVIVGHVVRTDPYLLTATFEPPDDASVLLADGVQAAGSVPSMALFTRAYGWVAGLDAATVESAGGVDAWLGRATRAANQLALVQTGVQLETPEEILRTTDSRARDSAGRFGLLAGSCAVLLLAGAVAGGAALRPDQVRFVAALRRRGLGRRPLQLQVALETGALSLTGALIGVIGGVAVAAVMGVFASASVPGTAGTALARGLPEVVALTLAAWVLLLVTLWPATRPGSTDPRTAWHFVTGAVVAGVAAVLLVISRGGAATGSSDPLTVVLPVLVLLTVGLATARLWPVAVGLAYRWLPRRASGARLGIAGIFARPLLAAPAAGLLAAAIGATFFALSYRSTLLGGAADQAAFVVPLDARVVPGSSQIPPLARASVAEYAAVAPGVQAHPVLRQSASVRLGPNSAVAVAVLGVEPAAVTGLRRFGGVTGGSSAATVARSLPAAPTDDAVLLPAGRTLRVIVRGTAPALDVTALLRASDGTERPVGLAGSSAGGVTTLAGALPAVPAGTGGWRLAALSVRQTFQDATRAGHRAGESPAGGPTPSGRIVFGGMAVDQTALTQPWSHWTGSGLKVSGGGTGAVLDYQLTTGVVVLHGFSAPAGSPQSGRSLDVVADPETARAGLDLTVTLAGIPVRAHVVATLPRMATQTGRFLLTDVGALSALVDWSDPGAGQPGEVWLSVPPTATAVATKALAGEPFTVMSVSWAGATQHALTSDPVAQGAIRLLIIAAALTLLVALAALVLLVVSERFEDAGELLSWEADGVAPAVLRRGLWARAALVATLAVPIGVACGLLLTLLTARLVGLTAGAQQPNPPLVAETGAALALPGILVALVVTLAVAGLVAAAALREPRPVMASAGAA